MMGFFFFFFLNIFPNMDDLPLWLKTEIPKKKTHGYSPMHHQLCIQKAVKR